MRGELDYSRALSEWWQRGVGFAIVEHDIVPWPGAVDALFGCAEPWCGYHYPLGCVGKLGGSLGCVRFSDALVQSYPGLWREWEDVEWWRLDGFIVSALSRITGSDDYHVHSPPVAHLRKL